jgi:hypothetical protein
MRLREARLLTALAIIGICGLAVTRGFEIVRFANARAAVAAGQDRADAVRRWTAVSGVAGAALEVSLTDAISPTDSDGARRRADQFAAILSVRPLSSVNWLSLAGMRFVARQPFDKVLAAVALSSLTGPNEGYVMSQRGIFGLVQWENLPADVRKRTATDLVGVILGNSITIPERTTTEEVLTAKSADTRREIAELLVSEGLPSNEVARIGLSPPGAIRSSIPQVSR